MPNPLRERPSAAKSASSVRLDSWKEIATFLGKAERTVKRWERDRDLPVHRVPGGGHASVYAYAAELTAWLESTGGREAAADVAAAKNAKIPEELKNEDSSQSCSDNRGILPVSTAKTPLGTLKRLVVYGSLVMLALGLVFYIAALRGPNRGRIGGLISRFRPAPAFEATVAARVPQAEKNLSHDFYLKGRYEWEQRTPDSLNRALDNFTQALIHDPGNAHAYVGMADTYLLLREYTTMPEDEAYLRAISAAKKAIELDYSLFEAHRALAFAETNGNWDFVNGEEEFKLAIQLNPRDPTTHLWYANVLASLGAYAQGLVEINKAQELNPSSQAILADKGIMLFKSGKTKEGIKLLKEVERDDPKFRSPHHYLMLISFVAGDYPTYLAEGEKLAESTQDPVMREIIEVARSGYEHGGERELLANLYAKQKSFYSTGKLSGTVLAKTCVKMGRRQEALQLLEEDFARHSPVFLWFLTEPDLLTLKDDPRYKVLLTNIVLPPDLRRATPAPAPETDELVLKALSGSH